jgi:hypothetical protein
LLLVEQGVLAFRSTGGGRDATDCGCSVLTLVAGAWSAAPGLAQAVQTASSVTAASVRADFDNDGFADLTVGVSSEDVGAIVDAGAVNMLHGSAGGLSGSESQLFTQDSSGVVDAAEAGDQFGRAVAVGDFDDGIDDLTVGVPAEDVGAVFDAGAVNVLKGAAGGLTGSGSQQFTQDSPELPDTAEAGDLFGAALAVQ